MDDDGDNTHTYFVKRKSSAQKRGSDDSSDDDDVTPAQQQPEVVEEDRSRLKGAVDLMKFLSKPNEVAAFTPSKKSQIVAESEEVEEDEDLEEEDDEEEDYETEEAEEEEEEVGPSDEYVPVETVSQEQLRLQQEHGRRIAKHKKKTLIKEYLKDVKRLQQLRIKNTFLSFKLTAQNDLRLEIIEKHMQMQREVVENAKENERLKQMQLEETCQTMGKSERKSMDDEPFPETEMVEENTKKKRRKRKKQRGGDPKTAHFTDGEEKESETGKDSTGSKKRQPFTIGAIKDLYLKAAKDATTKRMRGGPADSGRCKRELRFGKSFSEEKSKRKSKLSNNQLPPGSTLDLAAQKKATRSLPFTAGRKKKPKEQKEEKAGFYHVTKEARSRARLGLDHQAKGILVEPPDLDIGNLHVFEFEFADQSLNAPMVSAKIREDSLHMLQSRNIPTSQLTWPMQVKGFGFQNRNPYGRVQLNYTRLSKSEKELPYTAYRIVLTNIAYFRAKEQRLLEVQQRNQVEMEEERHRLAYGRQRILDEVIKGLRMWAGLSGITLRERREAKAQTETFIEDLQSTLDFLLSLFVTMYKQIHSHEMALRKLTISEDKGEGAQLAEFKEVLRCREKLKIEHKNVQDFIARYQKNSKKVLRNVLKNDERVIAVTDAISRMSIDIKNSKRVLDHLEEGIQLCRRIRLQQKNQGRELKRKLGLLPYPGVKKEYDTMLVTKEDIRMRKFQLRREISGTVRQLYKVTPSSAYSARGKPTEKNNNPDSLQFICPRLENSKTGNNLPKPSC